jgi:serine/threonine-protein kinase RsbW
MMADILVVTAERKNLAEIRRFIEEKARALPVDPEVIADMVLAVDEAATNIIVHGYQGQPGEIQVEISYEGGALVVRLSDQAPLFDPTQVPPPDLDLPLEQRRFGGLGIHLTRQCMDEVSYCISGEGCNELTLRKGGNAQDF